MKKTIIVLIAGCLTVHCQPPPERPKKDHHLHLENLIYSVALSSFKLAYQMDIKRKEHVLQRMKKQLEKERESSSIALIALEERVAALIEEKSSAAPESEVSEDGVMLQIYEANAPQSTSENPLPLEEKLTQLESLVFGSEGSIGLLFRVKFLTEKWALFNLSPSSAGTLDTSTSELSEKPVLKSFEPVDNESRLESLFSLFDGEEHYPGVPSQISELEEALSSISITEEQNETLTETATLFVEEQKVSVLEGASVEDRLTRLESLTHGLEEWKGIIPWIMYLKSQVAGVNESQLDDFSPAAVQQTDVSGSEG